jgi:choline-phosphate cytidylyltransferase
MRQNLVQRIENVQRSGLADEIAIEAYDGKINDVLKYNIDVVIVCEDWEGPYEYTRNLEKYCDVVRLERRGFDPSGTPISSTLLRGTIRIGVIGSIARAKAFTASAKATKGGGLITAVLPHSVDDEDKTSSIEALHKICGSSKEMWPLVDAVYISIRLHERASVILASLLAGKHVLCESPFDSSAAGVEKCYELAASKGLVLLEAVPSAFLPAMERLVAVAQNGKIGRILSISLSCSYAREDHDVSDNSTHGDINVQLATEVLLPIIRMLPRREIRQVRAKTVTDAQSRTACTYIDLELEDCVASAVLSNNLILPETLVVIGTEGFLTTTQPWNELTDFQLNFKEVNFEEASDIQRFQVPTRRGGYRFDLAEFLSTIMSGRKRSHLLTAESAIAVAGILERAFGTHNKDPAQM